MLDGIKQKHSPGHIYSQKPELQKTRPRKHRLRIILSIVMLLLLVGGIFVGSKLVIFAQRILEGSGTEFSFKRLFLAGGKKLVGEDEGEIRVLLLGIGGENHDGGTLTDTMILATLRLAKFKDEENKVSLISIPRDLVVDIPGFDYRKINSAYAFGEMNDQKRGPALAVRSVEQLLDIKIPYYATIDFQAFKKIVDDLDGVEINVGAGFTDSLFPDGRYGYLPPLTFEAGKQKMDGERALQYVRSRHGNNNQGTDFARSRRQQELIKAVKDKVATRGIFGNLNLLNRTLDNLADHLRTNIAPHEMKHFYDLTRYIDDKNIATLSIDVESGLVCNQIVEETGAYILLPCLGLGHYDALQNLVKNQFIIGDLSSEKAVIEIQSVPGSNLAGLAAADLLSLPTLEIISSSLKSNATYEKSIIYDNTKGAKPRTLKYLQDRLGMAVASSPFPFPTMSERADFVIIVTRVPGN
ncbi:MAG: LCP family protein [bacterium]|nr:LCP family protein [bacterium]